MKLAGLKGLFPEDELEWRVQQAGKTKDGKIWARVLTYVDARAVQNRLDEVCGQQGWAVKYDEFKNGMVCTIGILCGDEWIWKSDGAPETDIEGFKGGLSKSFVRAGSVWGIGRFLYETEAMFAEIVEKKTPGARYAIYTDKKTKTKETYYWLTPKLPAKFLPSQAPTAIKSGAAGERASLWADISEACAKNNWGKTDIRRVMTKMQKTTKTMSVVDMGFLLDDIKKNPKKQIQAVQ